MAVIIVVGITVIWVGAWLLRRRHLRKKEREFEMGPAVSWGPHQMHGASGGYNQGDGVVDGRGNRSAEAGGHHKEAGRVTSSTSGTRLKKEKMGWFKTSRV